MKIGDIVRVIDRECEGYKDIGKIKDIAGLIDFEVEFEDAIGFLDENQLELVKDSPTKLKIELTVKSTVFLNGIEMKRFELVDLRNKIDDVVALMD